MYESPRIRRLRNDLAALERLRSESSVFRFSASQGEPPQHYRVQFIGRGLWRDRGKVRVLEQHHIEIKLGTSYPRTIPEIRWLTPVYHPNISEIGMVCLGGYGTHWVPSVQLDELCTMLWDMLRYHNYDIRSPYNRDAALWVAQQETYRFPTDDRPLRDLRAALGRIPAAEATGTAGPRRPRSNESESAPRKALNRAREFARRYGRVFSTVEEEPGPAGASPSNSELSELVAAQSAASRDARDVDEPVLILEPEADDQARRSRTTPPPLPLFARPPRDDRPASRGDDIVFIE